MRFANVSGEITSRMNFCCAILLTESICTITWVFHCAWWAPQPHFHDGVIHWKHFPRHWPLCGEFTGDIFHITGPLCEKVTGEFPAKRPATRSFDVFFDPRQNKRLSKQWRGWWFETSLRSLWRHCNVLMCTVVVQSRMLCAWRRYYNKNMLDIGLLGSNFEYKLYHSM